MPSVDYVAQFNDAPLFKRIKSILQQDGRLIDSVCKDLELGQVAVIEVGEVNGSLILHIHKVVNFQEQAVTEDVPGPNGKYYYKLSKTKTTPTDLSLLAIKSPITDKNRAEYQRYQIVIIRDCLELEPELL